MDAAKMRRAAVVAALNSINQLKTTKTEKTIMKKDLRYYAQKALTAKKSRSIQCDLALEVDGDTFKAYEVSIANRDLLFYCDKGTANYVVDTYGDRVTVELFDWEKDSDSEAV
jgi:hypothetical protein